MLQYIMILRCLFALLGCQTLDATTFQVQLDQPISIYWYNIYDSSCTNYIGVTGSNRSEAVYCLLFDGTYTGFVTYPNGTVLGYGRSITCRGFSLFTTDCSSAVRLTSVSVSDTLPIGILAGYTPCSALSRIIPCSPPSRRLSGVGYTIADCCIDATLPTCSAYRTMDFSNLSGTVFQCVGSYFGFGSPVATPCHNYYRTESPFSVSSAPTGNVFTNFGSTNVVNGFSCYIENWSNYRDKSWGVPYDYVKNINDCDEIYYAFHAMEGIGFREPHDEANIASYVKQGIPTLLTIGGWEALGSNDKGRLVYEFITTRKQWFIDMAVKHGLAGIDFDIEWPGRRGLESFNYSIFIHSIVEICQGLVAVKKECYAGVLAQGDPYDPEYYRALAPVVHRVNLFAYDYHGCFSTNVLPQHMFDIVGSYYSVRKSIDNLLLVFDPTVIAIGYPTYVRGYKITGSTVSCFPLKSESGLLEDGIDVLVVGTAGIVPKWCTTRICVCEPSVFLYTHVCNFTFLDGKAVMYYQTDEDIYQESVFIRQTYGITNFYVYAHSMAPDVSSLYASAVRRVSTRHVRAVQAPAYSYPQMGPRLGTVQCPGIVYYSTTMVVTSIAYGECIKPEGLYCYYKASNFDCRSFVREIAPQRTDVQCDGVDTSTLLPASSKSVRVMCDTMLFFVKVTSVCTNLTFSTTGAIASYSIPITVLTDFQQVSLRVDSGVSISYSTIAVPDLCSEFVTPPSCVEFICGTDSTCISTLQSGPYSQFCSQISDLITEYEVTLRVATRTHLTLKGTVSSIFNEASKQSIATRPTRTKRFAPILAFGVGWLLSSIFGSKSGVSQSDFDDLKSGVNALGQRTSAVEKGVVELQTGYNNLVTNIKDFATQTDKRFSVSEENIQKVNDAHNELVKSTNRQFNTLGSAISVLSADIVDIKKAFASFSAISGGAASYTAYLVTLIQKGQNYVNSLSNLNFVLLNCLIGVSSRSLRGCTDEDGVTVPISIDSISVPGATVMVFIYGVTKDVGTVSYHRAFYYCDDKFTYASAGGCQFVLVGATVHHYTMKLTACPDPAIVIPQGCLKSSMKFYPNYTSSGFKTNLYDWNAAVNSSRLNDTNVEFTPEVNNITQLTNRSDNFTAAYNKLQSTNNVSILQPSVDAPPGGSSLLHVYILYGLIGFSYILLFAMFALVTMNKPTAKKTDLPDEQPEIVVPGMYKRRVYRF